MNKEVEIPKEIQKMLDAMPPFELVSQDYDIVDDYDIEKRDPNNPDKNKMGLGLSFAHNGSRYRAAIKFDKNVNGDELLKLWTKLAKSIANPEDKDSKVSKYPDLLMGNEITLEDIE